MQVCAHCSRIVTYVNGRWQHWSHGTKQTDQRAVSIWRLLDAVREVIWACYYYGQKIRAAYLGKSRSSTTLGRQTASGLVVGKTVCLELLTGDVEADLIRDKAAIDTALVECGYLLM